MPSVPSPADSGRSSATHAAVRDRRREAVLVDAAQQYIKRGFAVLPIPAGQKGPAGLARKNWQHIRLKVNELPNAFRGAGNIGLILGKLSGELVDVDLDCDEARALADTFLPHTDAVTGRPGSPRSHRWYVSPGIATARYRDPVTHASLLELRGTGSQTLVGPSMHPSGEPYDQLDGKPAIASPKMLMAAVSLIAREINVKRHGKAVPLESPYPCSLLPVSASILDRDHLLKRAAAYLGKMPPAISGQGGHNATYWAAIVLVHGFDLTEVEALHLLEHDFNARCDPAWTERELIHKVRDAATKPHRQPRGWLLRAYQP